MWCKNWITFNPLSFEILLYYTQSFSTVSIWPITNENPSHSLTDLFNYRISYLFWFLFGTHSPFLFLSLALTTLCTNSILANKKEPVVNDACENNNKFASKICWLTERKMFEKNARVSRCIISPLVREYALALPHTHIHILNENGLNCDGRALK